MSSHELTDAQARHAHNPDEVARLLPAWLARGEAETLQALSDSLLRSQHFQQLLHARFGRVLSPRGWGEPVFRDALAERFGQGLDAERVWLRRGERNGEPLRQSLFESALHNFEYRQHADPGQSPFTVEGQADYEPPLNVAAFVEFIRQLDLGKRYQAYLDGFFKPSGSDGVSAAAAERGVVSMFTRSMRYDLEVALHLARLQGRLDDAFHTCLVNEVRGFGEGYFDSVQLTLMRLSILDCPLSEIVLFSASHPRTSPLGAVQRSQVRLSIYIPGDPHGEIQSYATFEALMAEMHTRLADDRYRQFIGQFVALQALPGWLDRVERRVFRGTPEARIFNPQGQLAWLTEAIEGELFEAMYRYRRDRLYENARFQAVPTDVVDQSRRHQLLVRAEALGLDLLNVAAFVVPGLGAIMLGVAAVQMMALAYEGFEDWQQGDRQEAFDCLTEVVEQVGVGVAIGAGLALTARTARFFHGLTRITRADGSARLWHADLAHYRLSEGPPASAQVDEFGVHSHSGQHCLFIDGHWYGLERSTTGTWQLRHPRRPHAYKPELLHDGATGWRMEGEHPEQWPDNASRVRRLGGLAAHFTEGQVEQLLAMTGVDDGQLTAWHRHSVAPPPVFQEVVQRVALAGRLDVFESGLRHGKAEFEGQLLSVLLQRLPGWTVEHTSVLSGTVRLKAVIDALPAANRQVLRSGAPLKANELVWTETRLLAVLQQQRSEVFQVLYTAGLPDASVRIKPVMRDFPGLPVRVADRLVQDCSDAERDQLQAGHVPLQLASRARQALGEWRDVKRLEPFYLEVGERLDPTLAAAHGEVAARRERLARGARAFNPPQRLGSRIGYPLSGRRPRLDLMLEGIRRELVALYPGYTEEDVRAFLVAYRLSTQEVRTVIARLRTQLGVLQRQLSHWVSSGIDQSVNVLHARSRAAREIERCWRRQGSRLYRGTGSLLGYSMSLGGLRVGELPELDPQIDFSHVVELSLGDVGISHVPAGFIERFTGLRFLDLSNNTLDTVPALEQVDGLTGLHLQHNRIRFDSVSQARLTALSGLQELNLSSNPLGTPPSVQRLWHLERVFLRDSAITRLPTGLLSRPLLRFCDLRSNRITTLPDALFEEPRSLLRTLLLDDNPLDERSRRRLEDQASPSPRRVFRLLADTHPEQGSSEDFWTLGDPVRVARWRATVGRPEAAALGELLDALRRTSEARVLREDLTRRVWGLLDGAAGDPVLASDLYDLAGNPTTCTDSVLVSFSNLEVRGLLRAALLAGMDDSGATQRIQLARGLFRLEQVEVLARADVARRNPRQVDPLEVSLAYRTGLARILDLPGQSQSMTYVEIAGVTSRDLAAAEGRVRNRERSSAWPRFLESRDFWTDYLRERYRSQFDVLTERLADQLEAFEQRTPAPSEGELLEEGRRLKAEFELREGQLIELLTHQELQRQAALEPAPGPSSGSR